MASVMSFVLPANLVDSVRTDPAPGRHEWLSVLPDIVVDLAERWSLRLGQPYQPGGRCAWVAAVRDAGGRDLVLKVAWRHDEATDEADGLRAWAGEGAVRVHDSAAFDRPVRCCWNAATPGPPSGRPANPEQTEVVAALLQRLWNGPTDGYPFRPLQVMCDAWAAEFDAKLTASVGLDPGLDDPGSSVRSLPATAERQVLLCTDLHAGNVLAAQREPWLAIDPNRTWAIQPTMRCNTCSTARNVWLPTRGG